MAESSWPTVAGGRVVDDVQWEQLATTFAADGIVATLADTPVVYADATGMQVKIRSGKWGVVRGHGWTSGATETTKTIGANASGSTRFDLIVLRLDRATWAVTVQVKAGTAGAGVPALTQVATGTSSGTYEVALAQVTITSGASTITAAAVQTVQRNLFPPNLFFVPDATMLNAMPGPFGAGQLAWVDSVRQLYSYIVGTGWRAVNWSQGWGIVGGRWWTGSGVLANALFFTGYTDTGMRTGSTAMLPGRHYSIEVGYSLTTSATSDVTYYTGVQVRKPSGTIIGEAFSPPFPVYQAWYYRWAFDYEPASNETLDLQFWGFVAKVGGSQLNWVQIVRSAPTYFRVVDIGPAGSLLVG